MKQLYSLILFKSSVPETRCNRIIFFKERCDLYALENNHVHSIVMDNWSDFKCDREIYPYPFGCSSICYSV